MQLLPGCSRSGRRGSGDSFVGRGGVCRFSSGIVKSGHGNHSMRLTLRSKPKCCCVQVPYLKNAGGTVNVRCGWHSAAVSGLLPVQAGVLRILDRGVRA